MFFRLNVGVPDLRIIQGPIPFELDHEGHVVKILIREVTPDTKFCRSSSPLIVKAIRRSPSKFES